MRKSPSGFGGLVACGTVVIGLAAIQPILAGPAEAVPGLQRTTRTSVADSSTLKTVAARCPVGKRVLGGGGTVAGGRGQVVLQRLQPVQTATDDRFVVGAREDGTGFSGNWQLTAYAVCANPLPGHAIIPATSNPSSSSRQNALSFCPGQNQVGFGGSVNGGAGQVHVVDLELNTNGALITAQEDADGFNGAWGMSAYAVCANGVPNLTGAIAISPASSVSKSATATCPAGTRVLSAGFQLRDSRIGTAHPSVLVDNVAIDPQLRSVTVRGVEDETGTGTNWSVVALAACAP